MPRQKSGIDYFSLDVSLDSKFELIEAEYGLTGFAVVVKILQYIYGGNGYYCEWKNEVALLFSRKLGFSDGGNVVSEIVKAAIRRGMFDKDLYDKYEILTSTGIQKRYFEAVSRRKQIKVNENILLVNVTQICTNINIISLNVDIKSLNVDIKKQSRVEKSRVEKSRVNTEIVATAPTLKFTKPTLEEVADYCIERGKGVNAEKWYNHYSANGWKVGKTLMVDWMAAVRTWETNIYTKTSELTVNPFLKMAEALNE